jgi:endonuclease/exonuclease/phosphatase family metal-dependent hydrolase
MKKSSLVVLSVVFMMVSGACFAYSQTADIGDSSVVKAMTFNVRVDTFLDAFGHGWGGRKQIAADTISRSAPDVVGLQESLNRQVRYLEKALPDYSFYSAGRSNGGTKGESCAILVRKDRFDVVDRGTFWFSNTPNKPGSKSWGNIPPRICSWVYVNERGTANNLYVYNVHLDNLSQKSRARSVELLAKKVAERKTNDPFIVMGDFNMKIDNSAMKFLCQDGCETSFPKMADAWESVYPGQAKGTGTRHGFNGKTNGPRIDHIPVCQSLKVLDVKIDRYNVKGKYPSDHFPVIATISLGKKEADSKAYLTMENNDKIKRVQ